METFDSLKQKHASNPIDLMNALGVRFDGGQYRFGKMAFDSFEAAIVYAGNNGGGTASSGEQAQQGPTNQHPPDDLAEPAQMSDSKARRLGLLYDIRDVDQQFVPIFAKTARIIGFLIVTTFLVWGNVQWSYGDSAFVELVKTVGIPRSNHATVIVAFTLIIFVLGWRYRFLIGNFFTAGLFKLMDLARVAYRAI